MQTKAQREKVDGTGGVVDLLVPPFACLRRLNNELLLVLGGGPLVAFRCLGAICVKKA